MIFSSRFISLGFSLVVFLVAFFVGLGTVVCLAKWLEVGGGEGVASLGNR